MITIHTQWDSPLALEIEHLQPPFQYLHRYTDLCQIGNSPLICAHGCGKDSGMLLELEVCFDLWRACTAARISCSPLGIYVMDKTTYPDLKTLK